MATITCDQRDALDELGREDARRRVVAIHPGDAFVLIPAGMLPEQQRLTGLDEIVELIGRPTGKLLDDLAAPGPTEHVDPVEQPGHGVHQLDVSLQRRPDPGTLDLDRDSVAVMEDGAVHLADGGGRERRLVERREHDLRRSTQLLERRCRAPRRTGTVLPG